LKKYPDIKSIRPLFSKNELAKFENEFDFMNAYVEFLKQTITILNIIVQTVYFDKEKKPIKLSRNEAIIAGNLSRLIKLNTSFLQNVCEHKFEISSIVSRSLAETGINLLYMIQEGEENVLRNYVKHSLITEKKLLDIIKSNIEARGGETWNIEKRMESSINKTFEKSDFDLDEVNRSSKWKSIAQRAESVVGEMFYGVYYGINSHTVHGNWQDLYFNHLHRHEDGFTINLEWNSAKPQVFESNIIFNLLITKSFVTKEKFENITEYTKTIDLFNEYLSDLIRYHEAFLTS